tara:strand:+ start:5363 stop:6406 length:1044 start_codon:yes stop_codon:yes gene_type:complete
VQVPRQRKNAFCVAGCDKEDIIMGHNDIGNGLIVINILKYKSFKNYVCGFVLGLAVLLCPLASGVAAEIGPQTIIEKAEVRPALWKIDSAKSDIYLFGSVHMLRSGVDWYRSSLRKAFSTADMLVMETVIDEGAQREIRHFIAAHGLYPAGETLQRNISSDLFAEVVSMAEGHGIPGAAINALRPWYVSMLLSVQAVQKLGLSQNNGVEAVLMKEARQAQKGLRGLERPLQQMQAMSNYAPAVQEEMLKDTLAQLGDIDNVVDRMEAAWGSGDLRRIEDVILKPMQEQRRVYQVLLVDRNRAWVEQIEELIQNGAHAFVVVGAAHLAGEDSLIEMLRHRGHHIRRVP